MLAELCGPCNPVVVSYMLAELCGPCSPVVVSYMLAELCGPCNPVVVSYMLAELCGPCSPVVVSYMLAELCGPCNPTEPPGACAAAQEARKQEEGPSSIREQKVIYFAKTLSRRGNQGFTSRSYLWMSSDSLLASRGLLLYLPQPATFGAQSPRRKISVMMWTVRFVSLRSSIFDFNLGGR